MEKYKEYALKVLNGEIVAGEYIKLACQRYLAWFERGDIFFNCAKADEAVNFIQHLKHPSGKTAGKNFILMPWLKFIVYNIYGWYYRERPTERVTTKVFILVARKNGKSSLLAALALYELMMGERGSQCYNIANSREQSMLLFQMQQKYGRSIDPKGKYLRFLRDRMFFDKKGSYSRTLASDTTKLDGLSTNIGILDETHEYVGSGIYDVIASSLGFVQNPLIIQISTAGFRLWDFCHNYRNMCIEILRGAKNDDTMFSAIFELDVNDKWDDPNVWIKANPALDTTLTTKYLKELIQSAKNSPSLEVGVRTKNLNQWLSSSDIWLTNDEILKCTRDVPIEFFKDRITTIGVDLASVSDLTAVSLCAKDDDGKPVFKSFAYIPSSCLENNVNAENYKMWKRRGLITVCPGNCTDYDFIINDMLRWRQMGILIDKVYYDQYNSILWAIQCTENGFDLEPYSLALYSFNKPTKEFERQTKLHNVVIDNNEVTRWCFGNVALKFDHNDNCKPIKGGTENGKIDIVIAMLEAFAAHIEQPHYNNLI